MAAVVMIDDRSLRAPLLELNVLWTSEPQDWRPPHRRRQAVRHDCVVHEVVTGFQKRNNLYGGLIIRRTGSSNVSIFPDVYRVPET